MLQTRESRRLEVPPRFRSALASLPAALAAKAAPGVWPTVLGMLPTPCRILDAGAGGGGMSRVLHAAGYDVTSIDLHPDHFQADGLTCLYADLAAPLPFPGEHFDTVLAIEVAEHLENPWAFLREALRVVRPRGQVIFSSPNVCSLPSRFEFLRKGSLHYFREESFVGVYHVTPIFPWAVERFCRSAGGSVAETRYSRVEWPRPDDVPRHYRGPLRRAVLGLLRPSALLGEITAYRLVKD